MSRGVKKFVVEAVAVLLSILIFWVPFYFVILNSFKTKAEAAEMSIVWPKTFQIIENYTSVLTAENGIVIRAFYNSTIITVLSIVVLIIVCSMAGFVMQRRTDKASTLINFIVLAGLMIPPSIVPTIWVLNRMGLFKTLMGLILVEVALAFPFSSILYKGFMVSIPREIDESAVVDGCSGFRMFFQIIFPLLKPVTSTIIVLSAVTIFNDFANPLYFLPGAKNATVQLTLYNFMSRYITSWNLLFADVVLISIPPLILFIFFNKKIVAGMTAGAVKA
ncbi:MAG: carbohydrate transporter rane protein 2, family [Clostridia bacterium]|jgi:raffinose/stachyose/melibiose transport system permease protein|uniref:carbohydrate ABC transporter permease n=1 Tax=Petroclostridium xylanilyticum TaxID=1792311 RepID=UPI000B9948C7|nr:carbohydrate ABC transporter permease [Petroclostridium xylanilyticum]MBZ4647263.1 carbohydrate transporter rane protein 2, family [Clostridia bacterium]